MRTSSAARGTRGEAAAPASITAPKHHPLRWRVKRVALVCAMSLASINTWTGSPLAALWVGSRVQGSGPPTMGAIATVAAVMGVLSVGILRLLGALGSAYDRLIGLPTRRKRQSPWLRSLRGEREDLKDPERDRLSALEVVVIGSVILAAAAFEIWFFFFSSSSIDQRSGR